MNPLLKLIENPRTSSRQFKSVYGLSQVEFQTILEEFEPIWQGKKAEAEAILRAQKPLKIKPGSGAKSKLPTASSVLAFVLYYLKQYPTFDALGAHFEMSGGQANRLFHQHRKTLMEALGALGVLPKTKFKDVEEFQAFIKANNLEEILADATERPIQRPQDKQEQEAHYSGKKNDTPLRTPY